MKIQSHVFSQWVHKNKYNFQDTALLLNWFLCTDMAKKMILNLAHLYYRHLLGPTSLLKYLSLNNKFRFSAAKIQRSHSFLAFWNNKFKVRESKHELLCQRHITTARGVLQSQPAKSLSVAELIELRAVCTI